MEAFSDLDCTVASDDDDRDVYSEYYPNINGSYTLGGCNIVNYTHASNVLCSSDGNTLSSNLPAPFNDGSHIVRT